MDRCCRCKKDLGFGSVIVVEAKGDRISMVHFFCAKPDEIKALYGVSRPPLVFPMGDPSTEG
jgi:hypothetical protein